MFHNLRPSSEYRLTGKYENTQGIKFVGKKNRHVYMRPRATRTYAPRSPVADNSSSERKIPISTNEHRVLFGVGHMFQFPLCPRCRSLPPCLGVSQLWLFLLLRSAWTVGRLELGVAAAPCRRNFLLEKLLLPAPPAFVLVPSVLPHRCFCRFALFGGVRKWWGCGVAVGVKASCCGCLGMIAVLAAPVN